jgi:hypothetical protein
MKINYKSKDKMIEDIPEYAEILERASKGINLFCEKILEIINNDNLSNNYIILHPDSFRTIIKNASYIKSILKGDNLTIISTQPIYTLPSISIDSSRGFIYLEALNLEELIGKKMAIDINRYYKVPVNLLSNIYYGYSERRIRPDPDSAKELVMSTLDLYPFEN